MYLDVQLLRMHMLMFLVVIIKDVPKKSVARREAEGRQCYTCVQHMKRKVASRLAQGV